MNDGEVFSYKEIDYVTNLIDSVSTNNLYSSHSTVALNSSTIAPSSVTPSDQSYTILYKYSRHIPEICLNQILLKLGECFMMKTEKSYLTSSWNPLLRPSTENFYGVLLFVDISGFTLLSTKLSIDELRYHINTYFDKILKVCKTYGGQTVKFAGDAVYVVWQVPNNSGKHN